MDDKQKVIEAFKNSEDPLNAKKVSRQNHERTQKG